jgi:multicomponent Na+:H+ antiporter subunit E
MIRAALIRALLFGGAWWALAGGSAYGLPLAAASVVAATAASLALSPPGRWRWTAAGVAGFVPFFLRQSVAGGVDVARRAFLRRMPLRPGFVAFRFRIASEPARVFMMNAMNLLPGTLSTRISGDVVRVHVLDVDMPTERVLRELEERVARLFGEGGSGDEAGRGGGRTR